MPAGPGPNNDITDVRGVSIGAAEDPKVGTGVTVVLPDRPAIVAGDVRGGGPGARETDLLRPSTLVDRTDAIVLSGGSSYGLGAADGVAAALGAQGRGFQLVATPGVPPSPIVVGAILYDLANGGDKNWGATPPYPGLGRAALSAARNGAAGPIRQGSAGAGFGAQAGAGVGGLGSASFVTEDGLAIGALMAVNSFGSPRMPGSEAFWSWPYEINGEFGGARPAPDAPAATDLPPDTKIAAAAVRANTTIGVVALSASMSQAAAERIAVMAQDGIARAIRPVHGPTDGDAIFVLAVDGPPAEDPLTITRIGTIAADCVARAIARGIYEAERAAHAAA